MHRRILLIITLLIFVISPFRVFAEDNFYDNSLITREDRLQNAVQNQKIVLDEVSRNNIIAKCQNAQEILKGLQNQSEASVIKRENVYNNIQKEVRVIKIRMARQGSDASEADLFLGRMQEALDQFTLAADKYGTALDDSIKVDCQAQPEFFMASLILMRGSRSELNNLANRLHTIVRNSINDTFTPLKKRLIIQ